MKSDVEYYGNNDLLECHKWGFLASRTIPTEEGLRCYDWATKRAAAGDCVVSGFSSRLERDVLHFLLRGNGKAIVVLARRMYKVLPEDWQQPLAEGRMLIIATTRASRQSRKTALARNRYVEEISDAMYNIKSNING